MSKTIISIAVFLSLFFSSFSFASAAEILPKPTGEIPTGAANVCTGDNNCGNYSLSDFLQMAINISDWILGIVGAVALLFFVIGGFMFVLSGGSSDKIEKGKSMIIGSIIGLVIVFSSYLIIQFVLTSMGFSKGLDGNWSKSGQSINWGK
jgi:hypothetical protein